jgi:mycothiol synthase
MIIPIETDDPPLTPTFRLRPAKLADAEAVAEIILAVCTADGDPSMAVTLEDLHQFWNEPGYDLDADTWVAETSDGRIVGYEEMYNRHGFTKLEGDGYVHPDFLDLGIGTFLLRALEKRARQVMRQAEPNLRVTIQNGLKASDKRSRQMHENEGYVPVRFSWRMEIRLEAPPAVLSLPDGLEYRPFAGDEHARPLFEAVDESFRDHWGHTPMQYEKWRNQTLERDDFDPSLWFVAWDGDQIAGMSLCRYRGGMGWVNTLGVRRSWRKHGLGLALLTHSFGEFFRRGEQTIGLGVDAESQTGATRLYKRAGMHVASEYVHYVKELRPGRDVTEEE